MSKKEQLYSDIDEVDDVAISEWIRRLCVAMRHARHSSFFIRGWEPDGHHVVRLSNTFSEAHEQMRRLFAEMMWTIGVLIDADNNLQVDRAQQCVDGLAALLNSDEIRRVTRANLRHLRFDDGGDDIEILHGFGQSLRDASEGLERCLTAGQEHVADLLAHFAEQGADEIAWASAPRSIWRSLRVMYVIKIAKFAPVDCDLPYELAALSRDICGALLRRLAFVLTSPDDI